MADETTKCGSCENSMLVRTAKRYGGKCIPCANGYPESLEKARLHDEEQKRRERDPDALFWRSLCKRVDNPILGFDSLPVPEKLYFAVCLLEGEVYNGGFEQYFTNSYADYFDFALCGLAKIGDEAGLELTRKAKRLLFDERPIPKHAQRLDYFSTTEILDDSEVSSILDQLDAEFVKNYESEMGNRLTKFALDNGFWSEIATSNVDK